jgi:RNA polymerase sigma-70 factor (ECF subfamily)
LPLHFREVLLLCEVDEMSHQEIADTIAVPIGTVMSRLSRARAALRVGLQQKLRGT